MNTPLHATDKNYDYSQVEQSLVSQIEDYVTNTAHSNACIIGISGGIDSATVSTLCAKTGLKTILLSMPIHQNLEELNRAEQHINWLTSQYENVIAHTLDLTATYEAIKPTLVNAGYTEDELYLALVNTRSRLRMAALYGIAQPNQGLVMGTGNKVEDYGIGFFTKYGDGGIDYSPIGGLLKSEVRKLAQYMGVDDSIVQAKPTDGLHPSGATDEDQIGATYDELEWAMEQYDLGNKKENYETDSRERKVMDIYSQRHVINAHKMEMPLIAEPIQK